MKKILVVLPHPSDSLKYTIIEENVKKHMRLQMAGRYVVAVVG